MRANRRRFILLALGLLLLHDLGMSASGHASAIGAGEVPGVAFDHPATHVENDAAHPTSPEDCGTVRSSPQRQVDQDDDFSFGGVPVPEPGDHSPYQAISRGQLASPPAHPPDLERAFFSVFRI